MTEGKGISPRSPARNLRRFAIGRKEGSGVAPLVAGRKRPRGVVSGVRETADVETLQRFGLAKEARSRCTSSAVVCATRNRSRYRDRRRAGVEAPQGEIGRRTR